MLLQSLYFSRFLPNCPLPPIVSSFDTHARWQPATQSARSRRSCGKIEDCEQSILGNLSKDVFERRTSTGSEVFSLLICLDANKFVLLSFSSLIKTIYPRFSTEPLPNDAKSPLPVDVRRSKTLLLKLPITFEISAPGRSCFPWSVNFLGFILAAYE